VYQSVIAKILGRNQNAISHELKPISSVVKSITFDNGKVFFWHEKNSKNTASFISQLTLCHHKNAS
jgi:IS30 family transposase